MAQRPIRAPLPHDGKSIIAELWQAIHDNFTELFGMGGGGGGGVWGSITGTLSSQLDLQGELDGKEDTGVAAAAVAAHEAAGDPHAVYLTSTEGNAAYQPLDSDLTTLAANITAFGQSLVDDANAATARTTLGLGNVDNTSDASKPVSTATQTALDGKQNLDATLTALAALDASAGLVEQTGADTFTKRAIGVGATTSIPTRADGDARWQTLDGELSAIAGLTSAADRVPYFTGSGTASLATFTNAGRALVDDADATAQRVTLGLEIGVNVQAQDAELAAIAGLTSAADRLPYFTGAGTAALATFTSFGRSLVDDADAAAGRSTLGLSGTGVGLVPAGGSINQVLKKASGTDYDYAWAADATGGGGLSDADYGDITVSAGATVFTIDNDVVTYAKMQNVSAASRLLGRGSAGGAGDPEEITLGTNLSMSGTTLNATGGGSGLTLGAGLALAKGFALP